MRVLVTAGATREPIDAVRFLSNVSTGETGHALATALGKSGHRVTLLMGEGGRHGGCPSTASGGTASVPSSPNPEIEFFSTAADLRSRLERHLSAGGYDAVFMTAAVSDFRPESIATGKISSRADRLQLTLVRNEKILPRLKSMSPRPLLVVGFKLTVGATSQDRLQAVSAQFSAGGVDAVVHNDLAEIRAAAVHPFRLFLDSHRDVAAISGVDALATALGPLLGRQQQIQQQQ